MIHVCFGICFEAPPDGTFRVDCDEVPNLPVELDDNLDAAEASGPSPGMCIEVPDGTSHADSDEDLDLADNYDVDRDWDAAEAFACRRSHGH